jgi:hypothetical protein
MTLAQRWIEKTMGYHRPPAGGSEPEVASRYSDIAVRVHSRAAYARLVEQFASFDILVQPDGRSGLFDPPGPPKQTF